MIQNHVALIPDLIPDNSCIPNKVYICCNTQKTKFYTNSDSRVSLISIVFPLDSYTIHTWENFGVGKNGEFGEL